MYKIIHRIYTPLETGAKIWSGHYETAVETDSGFLPIGKKMCRITFAYGSDGYWHAYDRTHELHYDPRVKGSYSVWEQETACENCDAVFAFFVKELRPAFFRPYFLTGKTRFGYDRDKGPNCITATAFFDELAHCSFTQELYNAFGGHKDGFKRYLPREQAIKDYVAKVAQLINTVYASSR